MKARLMILPALILAQAAVADPVKLLPSDLEMPGHIGPLRYLGESHSWPDRALGTAYPFQAPGMKLDVYVYDAGVSDIPDGAESTQVCAQFEEAKDNVRHGGYRNVVLKSEQLARTGPTQDPPLVREAVFEAVISDTPAVSYVWITGASKNFIKLRFSAITQLRDEMGDARRAILETLGDAVRPHLAPVAAPAADAKTDGKKETSIVINPGMTEDMSLGFAYLIALTAMANDRPDLNPPCGGRLVPDYAAELEAFRHTTVILKEVDAEKSKFGVKLLEVSDAGYLDEFVWNFRHRDSWGDVPPAKLQLSEFKRWSNKHLKRMQVPEFGHVEVKQPRRMTVEPL